MDAPQLSPNDPQAPREPHRFGRWWLPPNTRVAEFTFELPERKPMRTRRDEWEKEWGEELARPLSPMPPTAQ